MPGRVRCVGRLQGAIYSITIDMHVDRLLDLAATISAEVKIQEVGNVVMNQSISANHGHRV